MTVGSTTDIATRMVTDVQLLLHGKEGGGGEVYIPGSGRASMDPFQRGWNSIICVE